MNGRERYIRIEASTEKEKAGIRGGIREPLVGVGACVASGVVLGFARPLPVRLWILGGCGPVPGICI